MADLFVPGDALRIVREKDAEIERLTAQAEALAEALDGALRHIRVLNSAAEKKAYDEGKVALANYRGNDDH